MMEELAFPDKLAAGAATAAFPAALFKAAPDMVREEYIQEEPAWSALQKFQAL